MNKDTIRAFIGWLDQADLDEIRKHQDFINESLKDVKTREGQADARLAIRLIDEEIISRVCVRRQKQI